MAEDRELAELVVGESSGFDVAMAMSQALTAYLWGEADTASRNLAATTLGLAGDFQELQQASGARPSRRENFPNTDELIDKFGGDAEHWSYWPAMFVAPGPGEVVTGAKAAIGGLEAIKMATLLAFKGIGKGSKIIDDTYPSFDDVIQRTKINLRGWRKQLENTEPGTASHFDTSHRIERMEGELSALEEAGEMPFTFYAAKDPDSARYFADQFPDGVVRNVNIDASNLATVEDVKALRNKDGGVLNPYRRSTISHLNTEEIVELKKAGFDGATGPIDAVGGDEVVVFSPEQVEFVDTDLQRTMELVDKY